MKKIVVLLLAVLLVACSSAPAATPTEAPLPTSTVVEPSPTSVVIVQTVVVEATQPPTLVPSPTAEPPTAVPATQTPVVVVQTVVVQPTQPGQVVAPTATSDGLIRMDPNLGAGWFTDITFTKNIISLRCQLNKKITFSVKPLDDNITQVDFYYRIVDRDTGVSFDWQNAGRMPPDSNGNFVRTFSGEEVNANFRKLNAWLDFQFVGISRTGGVVGRSEKIEQQVNYTLDCP